MKRTVKELFQFHSGSGELTERAIYDHQPARRADAVSVYSSATGEATRLPACSTAFVNKIGAPTFTSESGVLLVARNGQAGTIHLVTGRQFTITDHAYAMTLKKGASDSVDPLFFAIAYQDAFFDLVTSKDSNGTFAKGVAENFTLWLPPIEQQRSIAAAWRKHEVNRVKLQALQAQAERLIKSTARAPHERQTKTGSLVIHSQGRQITDKELYDLDGAVPVITGADARIKGFSNTPLVAEQDLPCVSYQTKGNSDVLLHVQHQLFDANNTATMVIKRHLRETIDVEFLCIPLRHRMRELQTSNDSVSYIDTRILAAEIPIPIDPATEQPDINEQRRIAAEYRRLRVLEAKLQSLIDGCDRAQGRLRQLAVSLATATA